MYEMFVFIFFIKFKLIIMKAFNNVQLMLLDRQDFWQGLVSIVVSLPRTKYSKTSYYSVKYSTRDLKSSTRATRSISWINGALSVGFPFIRIYSPYWSHFDLHPYAEMLTRRP